MKTKENKCKAIITLVYNISAEEATLRMMEELSNLHESDDEYDHFNDEVYYDAYINAYDAMIENWLWDEVIRDVRKGANFLDACADWDII